MCLDPNLSLLVEIVMKTLGKLVGGTCVWIRNKLKCEAVILSYLLSLFLPYLSVGFPRSSIASAGVSCYQHASWVPLMSLCV